MSSRGQECGSRRANHTLSGAAVQHRRSRSSSWRVIVMMSKEALTVTCVVALVGVALLAAGADQKVELYTGSLENVDLAAWGTGAVEQTDEEMYLESESLRVDTKGFFEGGRLDVKSPTEIAPYLSKPEGAYVMMMVKAHKPEPSQVGGLLGEEGIIPGEGAFPTEPGAETTDPRELISRWREMGMRPRDMLERWEEMGMDRQQFMDAWRELREAAPAEEMMPEEAPPEGEEWMGEPGMEGPPTELKVPKAPPEVKRLRVLLVTDEGELDSGPITLAECPEVVDGWVRVVVPMSSFKAGREVKGGKIEGIALFGDMEEHFYVGQLIIGQEDAPLVADAGEDMTVRANQDVKFTVKEQAAGVRADYTWDFDDLDGIEEQGYGTETEWKFITPGYYVVTLTVADPAMQKVTRTDRLRVKVE